ncbi:MAG: prolipoprotein diacylglyceryl transferase [Elusimicrobiota bacterium]
MHPVLFKIFGIPVFSYGFFVALGFLAAWYIVLNEIKRKNLLEKNINDLFWIIILSAVFGGRLFYVLLNIKYYSGDITAVFKIWEGGLVFYGGLIIAVLASVIFLRQRKVKSIFAYGDAIAPGIIIGQAIGRIGCFFAGCCYGHETHGICGVTFKDPRSLAPIGVSLYPVQIFESAGDIIIFLMLWKLRKHNKFNGYLLCVYVIMYSVFRFFLEFLRGDDRGMLGVLSMTQGIGILLFVTAVAVIIYNYALGDE